MRGLSNGAIAVLIALLSLLAVAIYILFAGWDTGGGEPVSTSGYIAMGLGIFFTLVVGVGLMSLIFYSNRHGRD